MHLKWLMVSDNLLIVSNSFMGKRHSHSTMTSTLFLFINPRSEFRNRPPVASPSSRSRDSNARNIRARVADWSAEFEKGEASGDYP